VWEHFGTRQKEKWRKGICDYFAVHIFRKMRYTQCVTPPYQLGCSYTRNRSYQPPVCEELVGWKGWWRWSKEREDFCAYVSWVWGFRCSVTLLICMHIY